MQESSLSTAVNEHYLDKVMHLAEEMPVVATEDIFDARGMKLLGKGARVSRALQEKLIMHKLTKPLEASICVEGGVDAKLIVSTATRILDQSPAMSRIVCATADAGASSLSILSPLQFGSAMTMMLTISERAGAQALEHAVTVALLSICMAKKLHLSVDAQTTAALAGLLHDVGELYIDPAYTARGKRLLPHEWAHIVVHPRVGQMLIDELESFPAAVGRAVAEHHERFDGSGYPRRTAGAHISGAGQAVSVAEVIAGVLNQDHPLERAELALKIIPDEHAHDFLSAITGAKRVPRTGSDDAFSLRAPCEQVKHLFWRITTILSGATALLDGTHNLAAGMRELLNTTIGRVRGIERAAVSTGLDFYLSEQLHADMDADEALMFEKEVSTREIQWRLRCVARDMALHMASASERHVLAPLVALLDDDCASAEANQDLVQDQAQDAIAAHAPLGFGKPQLVA
jgi:HD-GYP domain-containing protein (c-di-GMP phosphodiesterase class II)